MLKIPSFSRALLITAAIVGVMVACAIAETPPKEPDCCAFPNPGELVLPGEQFKDGKVAESYVAAKEIPQICCKLFCYCGCDQTDKHTSLLQCFITDHTVGCPICQDEVLEASRLKNEGKSVAQIQQSIDEHFQKEYPFEKKPSKTLKDYRANRLLFLPQVSRPFPPGHRSFPI